MNRDERFYAFVIDHTSRSRSRIHRISIHKRWVRVSAGVAAVVFCTALYGLYSISQRVAHLRLEDENYRLRMEYENQRQQLDRLKNRVEAVEDASRRLSEISGLAPDGEQGNVRGAGGPSLAADVATITAIEARASRVEKNLRVYESMMRERARIPSIWPVDGEMTDGFGMRSNPFGENSVEFHAGQDLAAPAGTPVVAAGSGTVSFAGFQNGYGQLIIIDHGNGLTTRYGHLSQIDVAPGAEVVRGAPIGRIGSTGRSTGPHLHYEVRVGENAVSPRRYLPVRVRREVAGVTTIAR